MQNAKKNNKKQKYNGKYYNSAFARCLRECIDNSDITQEKLAKALSGKGISITRQTISLYAKGDSLPDIETFKKIIEVFEEKYVNYSTDYWLGIEKKANIPVNDINEDYGLSAKSLKILRFLNNRANAFNTLFENKGIKKFTEINTINQLIEQMAVINKEHLKEAPSVIKNIDSYLNIPEINPNQIIVLSSNGNIEIEDIHKRKIGNNWLAITNEAVPTFVLSIIQDKLTTMRNEKIKKEGENK